MPDDGSDDVASATLDAEAAIDSTEQLNDGLEESENLIEAFNDKDSQQKDADDLEPPVPSTDEDQVAPNFADPDRTVEQQSTPVDDHIQKTDEASDPHEKDPHQDTQQVETEHSVSEKAVSTEQDITSDKAGVSAASSAATLAAASGATIVPSISLPTIQQASYQPFATLTPNAPQLVAHPLVSMPLPLARRAVRIAPMGVLPLPPHGSNSIISELPTATPAIMAAAQEAGVDGQVASGTGTIGEMPKGKRRGLSGANVVPNEALTPEERTKQKRMLRNRESAARSRDKRKTKNLQLESSIAKHREKRARLEENIADLRAVVETMQNLLNKHKVSSSP